MVTEGSSLRSWACRKKMSVEGEEQRALIDEVVARVAHQADTIKPPTSDELRCDDDGIDGQSELEP